MVAANALDRGSAASGRGRLDPEPVQVAPESNPGSVVEPTAGGQLGAVPGMLVQMPAEPRFALDEKGLDVALGVGPASTTGRRDGDDHAAIGVDDDPEAP